jgi:hypothetical protein
MAVSWQVGPANSRSVRVLLYLAYGAAGGVVAFVGALLVLVVGSGVELVAVLLVVAFIAAVRMRPLLAMQGVEHERDRVLVAFAEQRRPLPLVGASLVCGGLLVGAFRLGAVGPLGYVLFGAACFVGAHLLSSKGALDPAAGTLTYRERTVSLDRVTGLRRLRLGPFTVGWLSYQRGRSTGTAPRLLVVPPRVAERLAESVAATETVPPGAVDTTTRRVLVGGACLWYLLAAAFLVALRGQGGEAARAAVIPALVLGLFGSLFLWAAYIET